jgi:bifunctional UDP-N-acetylglucosamine pyrophosphorylase/glucosamine-1-phosphate N-acetyltransferase
MASPLPKVLHPVAGRPMIHCVIESCQEAGIEDIRVVIGHGGQLVQSVVEKWGVTCFTQLQQLGTADAVKSASPDTLEGDVVILNGDHPLIKPTDIEKFIEQFREENLDVALVTCELKEPKEFGRVIRHKGQLRAIVEAKDASTDTLKIREINTGIYLVKSEVLQEYLPKIRNQNVKGEFYLTDLISLTVDDSCKVAPLLSHPRVAFGVNTQAELSRATRIVFRRKVRQLLHDGVIVIDPNSTFVEDTVVVEPGSVLYPNVYLRGQTSVGAFTSIEPNCYLVDTVTGESVQIKANTYIEKTNIKARASIGPFARLRPETEIGEEAHVGNFVEMKKVKFGAKSKAGHLTYLGDAEVGIDSNIGCGTITCNYAVDKKKYKTIIGNKVFVGSDSQFVAPVTVGDHAVIGSGSTITKDVPPRALAVARGKQIIKEDYVKSDSVEKSKENS